MSRPEHYLVLSPAAQQAMAIARLLRACERRVRITGGMLAGQCRPHPLASFDDPRPIESAADVARFDAVIPSGPHCTRLLAEALGRFCVGDAKFDAANLRCVDKLAMLDPASVLRMPHPLTWHHDAAVSDDASPLFFKPQIEQWRRPRRSVANKASVPASIRRRSFIFQERDIGEGTYGIGFIARNGQVEVSHQHWELLSWPREGGTAAALLAVDRWRIEKLSQRLLEDLRYSGWGLIEFKYCAKRNDLLLMEHNPIRWASIEFAFRRAPVLAYQLFGIMPPGPAFTEPVWPTRVLLSGPTVLANGVSYVWRLPKVWEPVSLYSVAAAVLPWRVRERLHWLTSLDSASRNRITSASRPRAFEAPQSPRGDRR